ncbi:MAG: PAS domain S-box protein [Bacteroidetes bacterium]|nr:PAS domain S-box protein [Bacteroidota bacterium]
MKSVKTDIDPEQEKEVKGFPPDTLRHLEALINGLPETIWSIDTKMRLVTANKSFVERVRMATGKTIKKGDDVLIKEFGKDRLDKWLQYYEKAFSGEQFTIQEDIYDPVKQAKHYSLISLTPLMGEGNKVAGVACHSKDITSETLNVKALEIAMARLERIMDSSMDMICAIDENDYILSVNAASEKILGYRPEEMIGKKLFDFIYPEDLEMTLKMVASVMAGNEVTNNENRYVRKDGSLVPLMWSARWDPDDRVRYGIARDATERKKSEAALQSSNERFEYVTKATSDIIWDWNLETNEVYYSGNIEYLFGHKSGSNRDNLPFYFEHVHPDDRERVVLYPDQVKYGTMVNWSQEYRFKKANGEYAFVLDKGIVIRDKDGVGLRMIGAMQDITLLKENELRVMQQNEKLLEIAQINAHEIRRPVATILGLVQLLNDNSVTSEADKQVLDHLKAATNELDDVIKRIIDKTVS